MGRPLSGIAKQPEGLSLTTVVPTSYQPLPLANTTKNIDRATHTNDPSLALEAVGPGRRKFHQNGSAIRLAVHFKNQSALPVDRHSANCPGQPSTVPNSGLRERLSALPLGALKEERSKVGIRRVIRPSFNDLGGLRRQPGLDCPRHGRGFTPSGPFRRDERSAQFESFLLITISAACPVSPFFASAAESGTLPGEERAHPAHPVGGIWRSCLPKRSQPPPLSTCIVPA